MEEGKGEWKKERENGERKVMAGKEMEKNGDHSNFLCCEHISSLHHAISPNGRIIAAFHLAFVSFIQVVIVHMLFEIVQRFGHVRAFGTTMRSVLGVLVLNVMTEIGGEGAGHVT